ncbi:hypothetical protein ACVRW4_03900 [Streptococcus phocae subsp. phocae]|uniref:Uncharacterized protein n=1 Tax=Streptococcus phocae TaxID=119224 RepID=A0A0P6S8X3_9STRE|nr:hypothetical protein [Streptococcus phocae]KGR73364.1 hypothetical protein NX86_00800 [Streptococcus phocae subsp. salmonis]KPJ22984.1 hypothetical protein AKK44_01660 [Streptococcus phocae]
MNSFEAFKATLSNESLTAIYDEVRLELAKSHLEGTEAFSAMIASEMAIHLVEKYHDWLNEDTN